MELNSPLTKEEQDAIRASRAPCPALNALANHGLINESGRDITFSELFNAVSSTYNLSYTITFLLCTAGFYFYGKPTYKSPYKFWTYHLTVDLKDFANPHAIAHPASLVHESPTPTGSPAPELVNDIIARANAFKLAMMGNKRAGLTLADLANIRVEREATLVPSDRLDAFHRQIAYGESALLWLSLRERRSEDGELDLIPPQRLKQWLGEERLPEGWWEDVRAGKTIGLIETNKRATQVKKWMGQ